MCISTLRVIRPVHQAPLKEFLKEFFRLAGCLYSDKPIHSSGELRELLSNRNEMAELNIVMDISPDAMGLSKDDYVLKNKEESGWKYCLYDVKMQAPTEKVLFLEYSLPQKFDKLFYYYLIADIIDAAWDKSLERQDLKTICSYFLLYDMFGYAQTKRAFRISRMGEVLELAGVRNVLISYSSEPRKEVRDYLKNTVSAFEELYCRLDGQPEEDGGLPLNQHSIYWQYARLNAARKVQELLNALRLDWDVLTDEEKALFQRAYRHCDAGKLLEEVNSLQKKDKNYLGTLFLAARLCQTDPKLESETTLYYSELFGKLDGKKDPASYSFAYYECGRYLEKISKVLETDKGVEIKYYRTALELEPLNYHAAFKIGCYYNKMGLIDEARRYFSLVHYIIMTEFFGMEQQEEDPYVKVKPGWSNIALKGLQYLFKAEAAEYKIYKKQGFEQGAKNCLDSMDWLIKVYRENLCVGAIYDETSSQWQALKNYHECSQPYYLLQYVRDELQKQIK